MRIHRNGKFLLNKDETYAAVDNAAQIEYVIKFHTAVLKFLVEEARG